MSERSSPTDCLDNLRYTKKKSEMTMNVHSISIFCLYYVAICCLRTLVYRATLTDAFVVALVVPDTLYTKSTKHPSNLQRSLLYSSIFPSTIQVTTTRKVILYAGQSNVMTNEQNRIMARKYVQDGMVSFRSGNVPKSIAEFTMAEQLDPTITPYLWQRGLSYYYNQQYDLASRQFRIDVAVNPNDVEEIVWDIASQLQDRYGQAPENSQPLSNVPSTLPIPDQLSLPPGIKDRRKIMVRNVTC
jgi:hypothetical protein